MPVDISDIEKIVREQDEWRGRKTINLIASENSISPATRSLSISDFAHRYAEGHPGSRYYQGTKYIDQIESVASKELKELLNCKQADVRPTSGNQANIGIFFTFLGGGDAVIANSTDAGGHISHNRIGGLGRRLQVSGQKITDVNLHFFPLTEDGYHIDVPEALDLIDEVNPKLLVFGRSLFLFPEPVEEFLDISSEKRIPILYDGAHVFGLIAGGKFQDPLKEGAHLLSASTHKTFPGPQRGVITSDLDSESAWWKRVDRGVFPGSSSNHHLHTLPPLVVTIREMKAFGADYARETVSNAKALAKALDQEGFHVEAKEFGYTESHQVAVDVSRLGGGKIVAQRLEENDIILNYNLLFGDPDPRNPRGLRIGVQEMTRFGMKEDEMGRIAKLFREAVIEGKDVKGEVNSFRSDFTRICYC